MINLNLLKEEIQQFITQNLKSDLPTLRLKKLPFTKVSSLEVIQQIQGKKIAQTKLPFLYNATKILYPPHLNLEQASSQSTAEYKHTIIKGKKGADITGGTGVDSYFISHNTKEFYYVEPNKDLLEIVKHNFLALGRKDLNFINQTAETFLANLKYKLDFIYLDPSRRDENKNKKILLEDLTPNIIDLQHLLLNSAKEVFVKLSPLLDIQQSILQLNIDCIYIISLKNEVKELLIKLNPVKNENPLIHCINIEANQVNFSFYWLEEKQSPSPVFSLPKTYLYMPNASILKSGAFKYITQKYSINKLHQHTHIYTSNKLISNFPGRIFFIQDINFPVKKDKNKEFNIISRNYPLKTEEIKKKYKLTEGGIKYLFFVRAENKNLCILTEKVN